MIIKLFYDFHAYHLLRICYDTSEFLDFSVSKGDGNAKGEQGSLKITECCSYVDGKKEDVDCLRQVNQSF